MMQEYLIKWINAWCGLSTTWSLASNDTFHTPQRLLSWQSSSWESDLNATCTFRLQQAAKVERLTASCHAQNSKYPVVLNQGVLKTAKFATSIVF